MIFSCSKDDSSSISETDMKLVTGINLTNTGANIEMQLGNPNVLNTPLSVYPNPPSGVVAIESYENMTDIWLVPANAQKIFQTTDFNNILNTELYTESEIDSNSNLKFLNLNVTNIQLNLENVNSGYYKVFVKINGSIYWDNIYVANNGIQIDNLINFWN